MRTVMRAEHDAVSRIEEIALLAYQKKLEDLEECELREVYRTEALLAGEGRAEPMRHGRIAGVATALSPAGR